MFVLLFVLFITVFKATCQQEGTLIQQRVGNSVSFDKDWNAYQDGFGDPNGNYWAGLKKIYDLTRANPKKIRFEMKKYGDNALYWSMYNYFKIDGSSQNYRLDIRDYNPESTAGNAMLNSNPDHTLDGMQFSTKDRDNDRWKNGSCSRGGNGGWWYNYCTYNRPNAEYYKEQGLVWYSLDQWKRLKWFRIVLFNF